MQGFKPDARDHEVPVGFVDNAPGKRALDYPRITIAVDGKPIDMLFDTGALFTTNERSAPSFDVAPGSRVVGSFIAKSSSTTGTHATPTGRSSSKATPSTVARSRWSRCPRWLWQATRSARSNP